ncbi:MAG: cysteine synthase A [Clostridia bacterium]|nr:cysteine synthase A [Clostridia bacterium]
MEKIYNSADLLIGKTPLLRLNNFEKKYSLNSEIIAKVELFNPTGSVKDRAAKMMIDKAIEDGIFSEDSVIIEPTSGNTGIGIASVAAARGYRCIIVMPDTMSVERQKLIKAYGAEVVLTDGKKGMQGSIEKAKELSAKIPGSFIPDQFCNPSNAMAHKLTTGPEIWSDTDGNIDIFVACVGTGGTLTGIGEYLKEQKSEIRIVAVEPEKSPVLSKGVGGSHGIQGIGAGFVPEVLNTNVYNEIITVSDEDAYRFGKEIARTEGILVGISSGAALAAAKTLAERDENNGKRIVVLLPDSGDRYLSTEMFEY